MNPRGVRHSTAAAALTLAIAAIVAACGSAEPTGSSRPSGSNADGSPGVTTSEPSSVASPTPSGTIASLSPSPSPSPSPFPASVAPSTSPTAGVTPGPTTTADPGNLSVQLCLKLPVADVEAALDVSGLVARPRPGDANEGSCSYLSGDRAVALTSWVATGARKVITSFGDSAEPVPGLGDAAIWVDSIATLYIRKGTALMGIVIPVAGPVAPEDLKDASITLGQAAAGRL